MIKKIAQSISIISHPLLFLTYTFIILGNFYPYFSISSEEKFYNTILWFVFLSTFLLPSLVIFLMMKWGAIGDFYISKKEERIIPMLFVSLFYFGLDYYVFSRTGMEPLFMDITYLMVGIMGITAIITVFWKISAHAIGMSAFTTFMFVISVQTQTKSLFVFFLIGLLMSGLVITARLYLKAHSEKQVYYGYGLGIVSGLVGGFLIF